MNKRNPQTKSGKKVISDLKNLEYRCAEEDVIGFIYEEKSSVGLISYNYMSTKLKYNLNDLDFSELRTDDIKIWPYWDYGHKS